jgi:hypothetical protein
MADEIRLANEFGEVVVERVPTRNGARLRISVPASGRSIMLCPLELEALTWQDHDLFSRLLQTPHGPEDEAFPDETASTPHPPDPAASTPHPPDPAASTPHPPDPAASTPHPPDQA